MRHPLKVSSLRSSYYATSYGPGRFQGGSHPLSRRAGRVLAYTSTMTCRSGFGNPHPKPLLRRSTGARAHPAGPRGHPGGLSRGKSSVTLGSSSSTSAGHAGDVPRCSAYPLGCAQQPTNASGTSGLVPTMSSDLDGRRSAFEWRVGVSCGTRCLVASRPPRSGRSSLGTPRLRWRVGPRPGIPVYGMQPRSRASPHRVAAPLHRSRLVSRA